MEAIPLSAAQTTIPPDSSFLRLHESAARPSGKPTSA